MLTGLISPDSGAAVDSGAFIYGHNVLREMEQIRYSMGVCPQHDVLFENMTVREHILFFSQLKGHTYAQADAEATELTDLFHLESRLDHTGSELSGGQKRKLSVAIAVCGGSKFIVLDEPTAGMDPLARRELWDLLASLRKGRTLLLTTHYMDEADVLGDRVGIMSLGQMQCVGSTQFLKTTYGAGYKLIFEKDLSPTNLFDQDKLAALTQFVTNYIPEAKYFEEDGAENQVLYSLPFETVSKFGKFFTDLESNFVKLGVTNYGVTITSLEDVFLKVGEDHTVTPQANAARYGIGKDRQYHANLISQIIGLMKRKLTYAYNDFITIPLVMLPVAAAITAAALYDQQVISKSDFTNDLVISAMYIGAYLGAPGLIAEFIVRERNDKLRNVLTVMGCDFRAYWIGTFLADYVIMLIPSIVIWITWPAANMPDFYNGMNGLNFFIILLFNVQLIAFSYFFSFVFSSPKSCISLMPIVIIVLIILPNIICLFAVMIAKAIGTKVSQSVLGGVLIWGTMITTPHGALFSAFLDTTQDYSSFISNFPPVGATIAFMIVESALYLGYSYYTDAQSVAMADPQEDPNFDPKVLEGLDADVQTERDRTLSISATGQRPPLAIERLRKVFPPKKVGHRSVIATEDVCFAVDAGEIFGLLGANGAGKTTTLSMLTRHLIPTSGNAFITNQSILNDFSKAATHLGVVTQNNSLWDRLSVESHLKLFARLRGVPEDLVKKVVDGTIDQLELTPHRHKLAMRLSGGMKRKLCVAIALIGDPEVVLLDEPSAGLDPVSRRNLWSVILRTMSHRAVILTTHSMDEAEALCKRIGIMVKGQLRALGTKQHLKNKFGSGYELIVKLIIKEQNLIRQSQANRQSLVKEETEDPDHPDKLRNQIQKLSHFVQKLFPSAFILSENGGLITYEIPKEEMRMGLAFSQLEENKAVLSIEDFTIAQPTLEQVFIRTVNKFSDFKDQSAGSPTVLGGTARLSVEGTALIEGKDVDAEEVSALPNEVVVLDVNKCGCTNFFVKILIGVSLALALLFLGISFAVRSRQVSPTLTLFGMIFLVTSIISCNILYCACCQTPKGADE
jgi:ATP-binding cassette subfamily A (ABC1) protein 3